MKAVTATSADGMTTVGTVDGNAIITKTTTDLPLLALIARDWSQTELSATLPRREPFLAAR
ncbi:hypothetical protein OKW41_006217 [Paraburkholderia sp. UCT70]|uniref:hypothetical protein n=1 Tax=Paraburkholderia sp. UCT70 TaxID=2991068 RepID=UPI003D230DE0